MTPRMNRRAALTAALGAAVLVGADFAGARAQSATPAASPEAATPVVPALAGYPRLTVTITDSAFTLSAGAVPAGIVHFVVVNQSSHVTSAAVLGPGAGKTMADLQAGMATPPADNGFPAFLYEAKILGGPQDVPPGATKEALLNIPVGDWVVFGDGPQTPVPLTSAASGDSKTNEPVADADIVFGDFTFNGFDNLKAGAHLWKITNKGVQPHMLVLAKVPAGTTEGQLLATVMSDGTGTPAAGTVPFEQIENVSDGVLLLSAGQTMWLPINLDAATYAALCFVTDPSNGKLHVMEGMLKVFTVS